MNYQRAPLLDELAAQYALGTLRGRARRRFEQFCETDTEALAPVHRWEDRLVALVGAVTPVEPPAPVWEQVEERIHREQSDRRRITVGNWRRLNLAIAAGVAALAIALAWWNWLGPGSVQLVAAIAGPQQTELWRIEAPKNREELRVTAAGGIPLDPSSAYELWAIPASGTAPVALGLMPQRGRGTLPLNDAQRAALERARHLAISLEPPGGSSTGGPTGPTLFVAQLAGAG